MNRYRISNNTKLIIISAPSGCGKTTIAREILKKHPDFYFSVSATTRQKRENEIDGIDYHFISKSEFEKMIQQNELVEWQKIYDDYYGTPISEIQKGSENSKAIIFDIDVLGALNIKKEFPDNTITIFIDVPSIEVLIERLKSRKTEDEETLRKRIKRVEMEMKQKKLFDFIVINEDLSTAVNEVEKIINNKLIKEE